MGIHFGDIEGWIIILILFLLLVIILLLAAPISGK